MKKYLLLSVFFAFTIVLFAQKKLPKQELPPTHRYYYQLESYSGNQKSQNEEIDKQKFPVDENVKERRLSKKPYYLVNVTADDFTIPDPPANSSDRTRAEINYLLKLQQQRTQLDIESSLYMAGVFYSLSVQPGDSTYKRYRNNLFHIGRSIGTWFNPDDLPVTAELMAHVWQDASYFIWSFKYKYLRIRPYAIDTDVHNLEDANWPAYPSGHAANSYINAFIYQKLAPEHEGTFIKDAYDMAHSREIIGVHYPSDSESARILARQLVDKLFENEKFKQDFQLAKQEWKDKAKESFVKPDVISSETKTKAPACGSTTTTASKCQ